MIAFGVGDLFGFACVGIDDKKLKKSVAKPAFFVAAISDALHDLGFGMVVFISGWIRINA